MKNLINKDRIELIEISFPVIISCIHQDFDWILGEEPSIDSVQSLLEWLLISLKSNDTDVVVLFERILFRLLEVVSTFLSKVKFQIKKSDFVMEFIRIADLFISFISTIISIDSHTIFIRNRDTEFVIEFIDFLRQMVDNQDSPLLALQVVKITTTLNKDYTTYKKELEIKEKGKNPGDYIDKTLPWGKTI